MVNNLKNQEIKLDLIDKKILYSLSLNSRISKKELAKKLRISQERLHYKISRLTKELIEPAVVLNYPHLGIKSYIILTEDLEEETLNKLINEASIVFLIQNLGKSQYYLYVLTNDIFSFCKEFLPENHFEIYSVLNEIPDSYNPFKIKGSFIPRKQNKNISLSKKDYLILYHLSKEPLSPIITLSEKTGLDRKTISSKIKLMQEANIIQVFRYSINTFKLGFSSYILKMDILPKFKEKILSIMRADNYSGFVYETPSKYFMYYMPPSHREIFEFIKKIKEVDSTSKIEVIQTTEILKLNPIPEKVLEIFKLNSKK